jgi:hypothetical protein
MRKNAYKGRAVALQFFQGRYVGALHRPSSLCFRLMAGYLKPKRRHDAKTDANEQTQLDNSNHEPGFDEI